MSFTQINFPGAVGIQAQTIAIGNTAWSTSDYGCADLARLREMKQLLDAAASTPGKLVDVAQELWAAVTGNGNYRERRIQHAEALRFQLEIDKAIRRLEADCR